MILRNRPFMPWILAFVVLSLVTIYLQLQVSELQKNYKLMHDAVVRARVDAKNEARADSRVISNYVPDVTENNIVVIYNRVPKTASTSFMGLVYDLCKQNKYHVLHINVTNNMHTLTLANQVQFANNITNWNAIKPAFYHGHMAFLNFEKFGVNRTPLYINLLRKPLDRFVSYYYFLRYGDNFRPHLTRRKHGDTKTFDECIKIGQPDCNLNNMWLQIPFLCGHDPACWKVGNSWALEEAKRNLQRHYFLIGITEELNDFVEVLESVLPQFFKGGHNLFLHNNKSHLRQTTQKLDPLPETVDKIQHSVVWKMENELYNFALEQFHAVKKRLINASPQDANQRFISFKIATKDKLLSLFIFYTYHNI
ncbi:heparan sulfate 2-O-sulfotransferase 1-like isoform X2 [Pseudomyrmex gracilis]|uniref:heparan sulfate 2-O-sulfotransferase 1-like isoform X2 n=1 Tax=Pseudomyrmex gracilis TaxID=219809 RepID=UPI0009956754|nr:heparan sulfate 2-O-sulfotransferase 1-like isoform X2 [Pseudomyrmex gracilis]